ncbi:MAG: hypothetical protein CMN98_09710 [Synechococcus sp. NP17]|jgi:hypothetical protein|nr:hypothetical protein [Synechococcus sp. NP17]
MKGIRGKESSVRMMWRGKRTHLNLSIPASISLHAARTQSADGLLQTPGGIELNGFADDGSLSRET